jgi:hypothetical protein
VTATLPRIERHGQVYFRQVKCLTARRSKEELLAEMRGLAWKWFLRLVRRRKKVLAYVSTLGCFVARAVHSGRRVCGHEKAKDAMSPLAQRRHCFAMQTLPDYSTLNGNPLDEALTCNTISPVPEQVAFRLDFPAWRSGYRWRDRRLIDDLMVGTRTLEAARRYGLSPARISQFRRQCHEDWSYFCADHADADR